MHLYKKLNEPWIAILGKVLKRKENKNHNNKNPQ